MEQQKIKLDVGGVPAEMSYPVVNSSFGGKGIRYGAELVLDSNRHVEALLHDCSRELGEVISATGVTFVRARVPLIIDMYKVSHILYGVNEPTAYPDIHLPLHVDEVYTRTINPTYRDWASQPIVVGQPACEVGRTAATVALPSHIPAAFLNRVEPEDLISSGYSSTIISYFLTAMREAIEDSLGSEMYPATATGLIMSFKDFITGLLIENPIYMLQICRILNDWLYAKSLPFAVVGNWNTPQNRAGALMFIDSGTPGTKEKPFVHGRFNNGRPLELGSHVFQATFNAE